MILVNNCTKPCYICGKFITPTENVYCNGCDESHTLCTKCIADNIDKLKITPVSKTHIFTKNLERWK